ncbi:hypothetical protein [Streptomyces sp. NPDC050264]
MADVISVGTRAPAEPDRIRSKAPLSTPDPATFHTSRIARTTRTA